MMRAGVQFTLHDKMDDDNMEEKGTRIDGLATANLAALGDYGIKLI
jgi:hypothetical protein